MKKGWNRCCFLFSNFDKPNSVAKKFQENKKKDGCRHVCLHSHFYGKFYLETLQLKIVTKT